MIESPPLQTFALPYTSEEETWLVEQFNMFDRAYHEMELTEDAFKVGFARLCESRVDSRPTF